MKMAEAVRQLDGFAKEHPKVANIIVNAISDMHTLKVQHNTFMVQFAQLAEVVSVLCEQNKMYHTALKQLTERVGLQVKKDEEFTSEALDDASERFKQ